MYLSYRSSWSSVLVASIHSMNPRNHKEISVCVNNCSGIRSPVRTQRREASQRSYQNIFNHPKRRLGSDRTYQKMEFRIAALVYTENNPSTSVHSTFSFIESNWTEKCMTSSASIRKTESFIDCLSTPARFLMRRKWRTTRNECSSWLLPPCYFRW